MWNYVRRHDPTDDILNDENALGRKKRKKRKEGNLFLSVGMLL